MTPAVTLADVRKDFGEFTALSSVSFDIADNEFFTLLGPSGCGKTTLLRMIAGFENTTEGAIFLYGEEIETLPPDKRPINTVFQNYALFPHMSVAENIGFGLKMLKWKRGDIAERVEQMVRLVKLEEFVSRKPSQLSGGQQQRTHDQEEALTMSDRIAVMSAGRVRQIGDPAEIYESPANRFVADFIGKVNLIEGKVTGAGNGRVTVATALGKLEAAHAGAAQGDVTLAIRPEKIQMSRNASGRVKGKITEWAYFGDISNVFVTTEDGVRLSVVLQNETRDRVNTMDIGDEVSLNWAPEDTLLLSE